MQVFRCNTCEDLAPLAQRWNSLAGGAPMRSFAWMAGWWRRYGDAVRGELSVLTVFDRTGALVGLAPWYVERSRSSGRKLRFLGGGEVCGDYPGVLCRADQRQAVVEALAEFLTGNERPRWDTLELEGVEATDATVVALVEALRERRHGVRVRPAFRCWRLALPPTWEEYVATLSKSHRKQVRRVERDPLDSGRAEFQTVTTAAELPAAFERFVDLHQRRRRSLDEPGCFASPRFAAFHREFAAEALAAGQLRLHLLRIDGRDAAAEYHFTGDGVVYAYQSGVDPERLDDEPGRAIAIAFLRDAIAAGMTAVDFLRGDEPYKAHWRAEPRDCVHTTVVRDAATSRLRHSVRVAGEHLKGWLKAGRDSARSVSRAPTHDTGSDGA